MESGDKHKDGDAAIENKDKQKDGDTDMKKKLRWKYRCRDGKWR